MRDARVRAAVMWGGVRLSLAVFGLVAGYPLLGPVVFLWVIGVCSALVAADLRVSRETMLIANLGVRRARVVAAAVPPLLVLEAAGQLVLYAAYSLIAALLA